MGCGLTGDTAAATPPPNRSTDAATGFGITWSIKIYLCHKIKAPFGTKKFKVKKVNIFNHPQ